MPLNVFFIQSPALDFNQHLAGQGIIEQNVGTTTVDDDLTTHQRQARLYQ
jgi:hypothetical protein